MITEYDRQLQTLIPDPTPAFSLSYVERSEEGIAVGGDSLIPLDTLQGALIVELLNAVAKGADPERLMKKFEEETNSFLIEETQEKGMASPRGLYSRKNPIWKGGVIVFQWGNIDPRHRQAVKKAMKTWSQKTEGLVRFESFKNTGWNRFLVRIGLKDLLTVSTEALSRGVSGEATIGALSRASLRISSSTVDLEVLSRTVYHELGHVLGLWHEHQRHDRDDWIVVSREGPDFDKLPKYVSGFRWGWKGFRVGWLKISIPYPIFWKSQESYTVGAFDFDSIMLYPDFPIKKGPLQGALTVRNLQPSYWDVETVKRLY